MPFRCSTRCRECQIGLSRTGDISATSFTSTSGIYAPSPRSRRSATRRPWRPDWIHIHRNKIERLWAKLKEWRAIATRYEKTACSFMGMFCLRAALHWI